MCPEVCEAATMNFSSSAECPAAPATRPTPINRDSHADARSITQTKGSANR
jgi:hypothetical protein